MKKNKMLTIVLITTLLVMITILSLYIGLSRDYQELNFDFKIGNNLGFNLDSDAIHFGTMFQGDEAKRNIVIKNDNCVKCLVNLKIKGNSEWISVSDNNFVLKKDETKEIEVKLNPPNDAELKEYFGTLKIYFWRII